MFKKNRRFLSLLIISLAAVFLIGCPYPDFRRPPLRNYFHDRRAERPPEPDITVDELPDEMRAAMRGDDMDVSPMAYILGPDDVVEIKVMIPEEQEPEIEMKTAVTRDGKLRCPFLGKIDAAGRSVEQITELLTELYADGYYQQPYVEVTVREHRSRQAMVFGYVSNPGNYPIMGARTSLLHLLLDAGGLGAGAGNDVAIMRGPSFYNGIEAEGLGQVTENINIEELVRQGDLRHNVWIHPGDMVHVRPEAPADYYYILGFASDGAYELPEDRQIGVMGAIVGAGGLGTVSRPQYTYLMRYEDGRQTPTVYQIDLSRIAAGKDPDIPVQPEDRIIVSTDWLRRGWDGLLSNLVRITPFTVTPTP